MALALFMQHPRTDYRPCHRRIYGHFAHKCDVLCRDGRCTRESVALDGGERLPEIYGNRWQRSLGHFPRSGAPAGFDPT